MLKAICALILPFPELRPRCALMLNCSSRKPRHCANGDNDAAAYRPAPT